MPETTDVKRKLSRYLRPLYIAAFFQSFVLWYSIEKLFMQRIGFDNTGIGFMVALYSVVMLVVETPSGILADRWSRKGVLILASICLALSGVVGGSSHSPSTYLICAVFWGAFFACYSGMYDTMVYDSIAEQAPGNKLFDYLYGRIQFMDSAGLVVGGLAGGLIGQVVNLRTDYFLSVPLALIPVAALLYFKEPRLHKLHAVVPITRQIKDTFRAVLRKRSLVPVLMVLITRGVIIYCIYEFSQLWLLALHTQTAYYGVANAILLVSVGLGGVMADRLHLSRFVPMLATLGFIIIGAIGLIVLRTTAWVVLAQLAFATGLISVYVIFSRVLHDNLAPSIRAGAASATSTIGRFFIIPTALLLGYISQKYSVYTAAYILLALALVMSGFVIMVAQRDNRTGLEAK